MNVSEAASAEYTVTVVTVKYTAEMTKAELADVNEAVDGLTALGVKVVSDDSCVISYTLKETGVGIGVKITTESAVLLKISGIWYIA